MATKREELSNPKSCLSKAADDEPIFVIRAQDKYSSILVRLWIGLARLGDCSPYKIWEAETCAQTMDAWKAKKHPD